MNTEIINMNPRCAQCSLCGQWDEPRWGVPTFNGDLVSNEFPDDIWEQGGGNAPACRDCFHKHAQGKLETFDHYYAP